MSSRKHSSYIAFAVHRISGLCLAIFLPVHFYVISLLLKDPAALDRFITWTDAPMVKFSESILILLACAHLANGIRLIAYEIFSATRHQSIWLATGGSISLACGLLFFLTA